jgi:hypothetical protein
MNSTRPARHRELSAIVLSAFVAALTVAGLCLAPGQARATQQEQPAAPTAARSTSLTLNSYVDCLLARSDMRLVRGIWTKEPPLVVGRWGRGDWGSESNLILSGTEGTVTYTTWGCADSVRDSKAIKVHWKNPYFGKNDYDANGTDPMFRITWNATGSNNANVAFTLEYAG